MRTRTIVSVASLVGLSLGGSAFAAGGGGGGTGTTPPLPPGTTLHPAIVHHYGPGPDPRAQVFTCSDAPTVTLCNNAAYQSCSGAQTACGPVLAAAGNTYAAGANQTCLMDATGDHCIPTPVKKYPAVYQKNEGTSWQAQEARAMQAARIARETPSRGRFDASTWSRNPVWASKTGRVDSCEAYVYAKYYDYERFLDAGYACGTDDQCVYDVAFKDYANPLAPAPRIAKRTLLDSESQPIVGRLDEVNDATFELNASTLSPKNPFYASAAFMPPAVFDALFAAWASDPVMVAKLHALQNELGKGYNFYTYGNLGLPAVEVYPTIWDWDQAMNNRLAPKAFPHAQQMEFLRRNQVVSDSLWTLGSALACSSFTLDCVTMPLEVARVTPGMAQSYPADPFAMASLLTSNDRFSTAIAGALQSSFVPSQIPEGGFAVNIGQIGVPGFHALGAKMLPGAPPPAQTTTPTGRAAAITQRSPGWTGFPADYWTKVDYGKNAQLQSASRVLQNHWAASAPAVETARGAGAHPRMDCNAPGVLNDGILQAACDTANVVLDEWARSLAGNESCLDMSGYGCDWSPIELRQSLLGAQRLQRSREHDYQECLMYTQNSFAAVSGGAGTVSYQQEAEWSTVHARIQELIGALKLFNQHVPQIQRSSPGSSSDPFPTALGTVYGDRATDKQQWGNSTFGAGYSYNIGWDAVVLDRADRDTQHKPVGLITQMQLDFDGAFEAHASAFGNDIKLLEADLGARINDGNQGDVQAQHYLYIIGFGTFDGLDQKTFATIAPLNQSFQLANPSDDFKENVFDAGFWVGPVYVHVGIDVEFFYGAPLEGNVAMPLNHGPIAPSPGKLIEGTLSFHPKAGVSADLYAYGGWGALAEVGVEAQLNLITVGLPMSSSIAVVARKNTSNQDVLFLTVKEGIDVSIETLSGELDLCGKIIGIGGCTEVLSWKGLHQEFPLFTAVDEEVELAALNGAP